MALTIPILAHPLQRSLSLFNTRLSIHPSHTHLSTPHLHIRHQGPQPPIPLQCILLSTIQRLRFIHLWCITAVQKVRFIHLRCITAVQVRFTPPRRIRRSILLLHTHHQDIARLTHQSHTLRLIRQSRTRLLARLISLSTLHPRILRSIPRLRTHQWDTVQHILRSHTLQSIRQSHIRPHTPHL